VRSQGEPVFVDGSGRRRRIATVMGVVLGTGLLASLGLIVAGLFGVSSSPPGLPVRGGAHAEQVPAPPGVTVGGSGRSSSSATHSATSTRPPAAPVPDAAAATSSPTPRRTGPPTGQPTGHGKPSRSG
jgi:hypothetical protein